MDDMSLTQTGIIAGTPHYMSPEQATGGAIDARSDLFSLGTVLYFMATGHPPFRANAALAVLHRICRDRHRPVRQLNKDVPDELAELIDRLLEKKPGRRPASAESVREELATLLSHVQQYGCGRRPFAGWRGRCGRRKIRAAVIAAAVIAVGVGIWFARDWHAQEVTTNESRPTLDADVLVAAERETGVDRAATLQGIERAARESYFLRGEDSWLREAAELKRDLERAESRNGERTR
jgi:hypothetical protein